MVFRKFKKINEVQPWKLEEKELKEFLTGACATICSIAKNIEPFLPETAEKILKQYSGKVTASEKPLFPRLA